MNRLIIILACCLVGVSWSQVTAPKYSNEFLQIGVGARGLALGKAQTADATGSVAGYWNPSLLLNNTNKYQGSLMHAEYFAGVAKYDYGSASMRIDSASVIALSVIRFSIDDIPDTRFLFDANGAINYDRVQFFSASDNAFLLSYARKIKIREHELALGGNAKVIYRNVGEFATAWGFGFDVGAHLKKEKYTIGATLRDATSTFNAWSINSTLLKDAFVQTGNVVPSNSVEVTTPSLVLGGKVTVINDTNWQLGALIDLVTTFDGKRNTLIKSNFASISPRAGVELGYKNTVYARVGASQFQQLTKLTDGSQYWAFEPSAGLGIKYKQFSLDYALTNIGSLSGGLFSNIFSLNVEVP